jgi:Mg2+/citrate symporter
MTRAQRAMLSPETVAAATLACWAALLVTFSTHNTGWLERMLEPVMFLICVTLAAYLTHAIALVSAPLTSLITTNRQFHRPSSFHLFLATLWTDVWI